MDRMLRAKVLRTIHRTQLGGAMILILSHAYLSSSQSAVVRHDAAAVIRPMMSAIESIGIIGSSPGGRLPTPRGSHTPLSFHILFSKVYIKQ